LNSSTSVPRVIGDNPRKGPKGKNPWIELDGEPIGDTELIIEFLFKRYGVDLDAGLSSEQKAIGLAWRRTFEEHFHQVLEWELFEHPAGATYMRKRMLSKMPPVAGPLFSQCFGLISESNFTLVGLRGTHGI
jgi:hypothetical protein